MTQPLKIPSFGFSDFIALLAAFSLVSVQMQSLMDDPGVGWHMADGKWIWSNISIPKIDPFLYSPSPRAWISDQWLSDLLMYFAYSLNGWPLIYGLCFALFMTTFMVVVLKYVQLRSSAFIASSISTVIAFKMAQVHFIVRPVILSFLLFAICYRELSLLDNERKSKSSMLFLPLLFALWANLHPSFVLGLTLFGISLVANTIQKKSISFPLVLSFGFCFVATFLNPYGISLHESVVSLGSSKFFMAHHEEWLPPSFSGYSGRLFYLSFAAICAFGIFSKGRYFTLFETLSVLVFFYLGTTAVRMLPYFGIVIAPPLAIALVKTGSALKLELKGVLRRVSDRITSFESREARTLLGWKTTVFFILMVLLSAIFFSRVPFYRGDFLPSSKKFPHAAVAHLARELKPGENGIVLSIPYWGGFITWFGEGKLFPLIDDRNTFLGEEFVKRFYDAMKVDSDWLAYAKSLNAKFLLIPAKSDISKGAKNMGLKVIFEDELAVLFGLEDAPL